MLTADKLAFVRAAGFFFFVHIYITDCDVKLFFVGCMVNIFAHYRNIIKCFWQVNMKLNFTNNTLFAELDVFLGQHILLTMEQYFNPKM